LKILKLIWRTLRTIKFLLVSFILVLSVCINLALFLGGSLFSILNNGFEAVTNIKTIGSRNEAEIAQLGDNLSVERQAKRELKTELGETSAQLVTEKKIKRDLSTQLTEKSAQLVTEKKAKRELKLQFGSASQSLVTERQAKRALQSKVTRQAGELAAEKTSKQVLQSRLNDILEGVVTFKGKKVALKKAVSQTSEQIGKRSAHSAARNVASMPSEAIPWIGTAVIVGVTSLEIRDLCLTMKDMTELQLALDPSFKTNEDDLEVCAIKVPPKEEILAAVKASPSAAWNLAREATPSLEDFKSMKMPDVQGWLDAGKLDVTDFRGKVSAWWSKEGDAD
jgi:myosin heavy subunit